MNTYSSEYFSHLRSVKCMEETRLSLRGRQLSSLLSFDPESKSEGTKGDPTPVFGLLMSIMPRKIYLTI